MSTTLKSILLVALLLVTALVGYIVFSQIVHDLARAPELSKPPALLTQQEIGDGRLLFDGKTTDGWKIKGTAKTEDGTLVLGGEQATSASLVEELGMEFELRFDFFQEGSGNAEFRLKPVLLDPTKEPTGWPERRMDAVQQLNLSAFVYKRWHRCLIKASYQSNHFDMAIEVKPLGDGLGMSSTQAYGFPTTAGCRCVIAFEVAQGSKLFLRNVVLDEPRFNRLKK